MIYLYASFLKSICLVYVLINLLLVIKYGVILQGVIMLWRHGEYSKQYFSDPSVSVFDYILLFITSNEVECKVEFNCELKCKSSCVFVMNLNTLSCLKSN